MKNVFFTLAFMLVGTFTFASSNIEVNENVESIDSCTITTTTTVDDANGDSHEVAVTNTGRTCFDAWSANQDEIKEFKEGIEPAN